MIPQPRLLPFSSETCWERADIFMTTFTGFFFFAFKSRYCSIYSSLASLVFFWLLPFFELLDLAVMPL
jgi:hypothetical protein